MPTDSSTSTGERREEMTMTVTHGYPVGARITLIATTCPIDDTTDGEEAHAFRCESAVVVEHLHGDEATSYAADYLVYVPKTRRVYPCVPGDMTDAEPQIPLGWCAYCMKNVDASTLTAPNEEGDRACPPCADAHEDSGDDD